MARFAASQSYSMFDTMDWTWHAAVTTSTSMVYTYGTHRLAFSGSFTYETNTHAVDGTISQMRYDLGGSRVFTVTEMNMDAGSVHYLLSMPGQMVMVLMATLQHADTVNGSTDADTLRGCAGNDRIHGGGGADRLYGDAGSDSLIGGLGVDTLVGGNGHDIYVVDAARDVIIETADGGVDLVFSPRHFALPANVERLGLTGTAATYGFGNDLDNVLLGNLADNRLLGREGNDALSGGGGDDWLYGEQGNDQLTGGSGADRFNFNTAPNATNGHDNLRDFSHADDTIGLYAVAFAGIGPVGALASTAFHLGTAAADASDRIVYDAATGHLFFDADGSGGIAQVLFATVTANSIIDASDFVIL